MEENKEKEAMEENKENRPPVENDGRNFQGKRKQQRLRCKTCSCKLSPCVVVREWDDMWEVVESLKCSGGSGRYRREVLTDYFLGRLVEAGAARVHAVPSCVKGIVLHHFPTVEDAWYD